MTEPEIEATHRQDRTRSRTTWLRPLRSICAGVLIGFLLEARPTNAVGMVLQAVGRLCLLVWLGLMLRGLWHTTPGVFRLRAVRLMLVGVGMALAAMAGWIVALIISGQRFGMVQDALIVLTFAGFGIVLVALLIGLFDASKHAVERYGAEHPPRH